MFKKKNIGLFLRVKDVTCESRVLQLLHDQNIKSKPNQVSVNKTRDARYYQTNIGIGR